MMSSSYVSYTMRILLTECLSKQLHAKVLTSYLLCGMWESPSMDNLNLVLFLAGNLLHLWWTHFMTLEEIKWYYLLGFFSLHSSTGPHQRKFTNSNLHSLFWDVGSVSHMGRSIALRRATFLDFNGSFFLFLLQFVLNGLFRFPSYLKLT